MNFYAKAAIATVIMALMIPFAKADELVIHTVAHHTGVPGKLVGNDNAYLLSFSRKF